MNETLVNIGIIAFIAYVVFSIALIIGMFIVMLRTGKAIQSFFKNTQGTVNAVLIETKSGLEHLRRVTENMHAVSTSIRQVSNKMETIEARIGSWYGMVKENIRSEAEANIAGLKSGFKTGIVTLVRNIKRKEINDNGKTR
ncbi:MAG: hypothetical protein WC539_05555 [Nitrospirota bacterium]